MSLSVCLPQKTKFNGGIIMENIIKAVLSDIAHGVPRGEAINDAANLHAGSYDGYCLICNVLEEKIPV